MKTTFTKSIQVFVFAMTMIFSQAVLSAQESIDAIYAQINLAFAERSSAGISSILSKYSSSPDYRLYESYTLKKTRQLIIENELDFAREASLAVIDNNLENFDAVDLYSYIDRAILSEQAARQAAENRARLEAERQAAIAAKAKTKIQQSNSYQSMSTASGSAVYMNEDQQSFSTVNWNMQLGIADVLFQTITAPESYSSIKYGLALGLNLFYTTDQFVLSADTFADFQILTMGSGEEEFLASGRFVPQMAFASISKNLFFRAGFAAYGIASDYIEETGSLGNFITPVFGIGLDGLKLGSTEASLHYDYCLGHFAYEDISTAMEMGGSILLPLAETERNTIGLRLGVSDLLFIKNEGIENRCKAIFAIGVGNVHK